MGYSSVRLQTGATSLPHDIMVLRDATETDVDRVDWTSTFPLVPTEFQDAPLEGGPRLRNRLVRSETRRGCDPPTA